MFDTFQSPPIGGPMPPANRAGAESQHQALDGYCPPEILDLGPTVDMIQGTNSGPFYDNGSYKYTP